jgi:dolichol-phosphate mannosyltransferase
MTSRGAQILGLMIAPQVVGRVSDPISGYLMVRGEIKQILEVRYVF